MKNDLYWANRSRILEEALLADSYTLVEQIELQYDKAILDIEKEISTWYQRFATNNGVSLVEARKLLTAKQLAAGDVS